MAFHDRSCQTVAVNDFAVEYDHQAARELHSVEGAREALRVLFREEFPKSVLDVGCGIGTWLRAALDLGAQDVVGIEGVDLPADELMVPKELIRRADLNQPVELGRTFDLVLCLETAEHLEPESAATIVDTLTRHGSRILFSAAVPGQPGMHHVNCQWPAYWQALFNERGFACSDAVRWILWNNKGVEAWYRQNLMLATRDEALAGKDPPIDAVIHPEMLLEAWDHLPEASAIIARGALPLGWYLTAPAKALLAKLGRSLRRR